MYQKCQKYLKTHKIFLYILLSTSMLSSESEILDNDYKYLGNWPIYKDKETILKNSNTNKLDCPNGIGCECSTNNDCINQNCKKHLKGDRYCAIKQGDTFPHFQAIDQFGETVDIYDFANNEGKYILVEMGAAWCSPCHSLASWFAWDEEEIKSKPFWREKYNIIKDLVKNGDIYFITILYEDEFHDNATYDTAYEWYDTYPDDHIPVLVDENKLLHSIIRPTGIPAVTLLAPDMKVMVLSDRGINKSFDKLLDILKIKKKLLIDE